MNSYAKIIFFRVINKHRIRYWRRLNRNNRSRSMRFIFPWDTHPGMRAVQEQQRAKEVFLRFFALYFCIMHEKPYLCEHIILR
ncbi:hypothetical protein HMPREF9431_02030 [Segatella oulorum F0390]|uniref:Uncharacterized protein n=1 Tax=Segatella oulorum F0390 TaxID=702438 RepID=G1WDX9_9BACT|nr:hypothetical protein HMPREF9431_02030 [Segatella oulorum F0390]